MKDGWSYISVRSFPLAIQAPVGEDQRMVASELSTVRRVRRWRLIAEKRQIVRLTLEPGASVAVVARAHGSERQPGVQVAEGVRAGRT
jgi:hypothetical protein